ncbi:MAG: DNA polymerase III subunit delta' [Desulfosarcina sp.]|nr:DNA polymerase III subunit delta' [Desulfosarcina sp.]MBC2742045.1 DNA polymerase III subunit delta' [Desulfosarcina sp.]MBC2764958.1 DNA polymerase III subunit delta' [Desulfosarcina sp.]
MTTATGFNAIVGQQHPIRLLKTFIRNGTLPHALLFTGDDGVGKKMTATAFAMACNCLTLKSALRHSPHLDVIDACGDCTPCRKIAGNYHPDIIRVAPLSSVIKIAQIRTLLQILTLKPNETDRRVVILSEAQTMNSEAGNALLKALEEPPDRTLLVLTARQTSDLLPTVVSRCRHIRFFPLRAEDIKRLLTAAGGIEPESVETVASLCGGSYTRARTLIDSRWLSRRDWIIRAMGSHTANNGKPEIRTWLALSEMLVKKKDLIEESLEIITMWLRDMLVVRCDPQHVLNQDRLETLSAAAKHVSQAQLLEQINAVDHALTALRSNTNVRLTLDAMVLRMAGAYGLGNN